MKGYDFILKFAQVNYLIEPFKYSKRNFADWFESNNVSFNGIMKLDGLLSLCYISTPKSHNNKKCRPDWFSSSKSIHNAIYEP